MNFYKHHIGDYAAATSHLSILEDGVYSRLLRIYYRDEGPLPAELKAVQRLAGARSRDEREAVETVLEEFFVLEADGWHSKRADEELAKYQAQAETNRGIARAREARRRSTGNARIVERTNHESCNEPSNESSASREPSHKPEAREDQKLLGTPLPGSTPGADETSGGGGTPTSVDATRALVRGGLPPTKVNGSDPRLLAAISDGATAAQFESTAREAMGHDPPKGFGWIVQTVRGRIADARTAPAGNHAHATRQPVRRVGLADRHPAADDPADDARPVIEGQAVSVRA